MATDYTMDYSEITKQHSALTEQLDMLSKTLDEMVGVEEDMLSAAQWQAEDKEEFTSRFEAYIEGGRGLHRTGTEQAATLDQIKTTYQQAEQG